MVYQKPDSSRSGELPLGGDCLDKETTFIFSRVKTRSCGNRDGLRVFLCEASCQLDLGETGLLPWVDQFQFERDSVIPQSEALTGEQTLISELKTRIHSLKREKAILEKAAAFLVSDEINRSNRLIY